MRTLIASGQRGHREGAERLSVSRTFFTRMVIAFSATSVIVALLLGFVLSWAFILPVRKMQRASRRHHGRELQAARGRAEPRRVRQLATDLNGTSERLATLFDDQRKLTTQLSETNASLERRQRGEVAVSRERQSRAADADDLDPRLHRCAPRRRGRSAQRRAGGVAEMGPARRAGPARVDQRDPRPVEDRGRQDDHRSRAVRPARARRVRRGAAPLSRRAEEDPTRGHGRGYACGSGARPPACSPDPGQPRRERAQVHRSGEVQVETGQRPTGGSTSPSATPAPASPPEQQEAIFEEFHQAEGSGPGTGLGLTISRRLARLMGATSRRERARTRKRVSRQPADGLSPDAGERRRPRAARGSATASACALRGRRSVGRPVLQKMVSGYGYRRDRPRARGLPSR